MQFFQTELIFKPGTRNKSVIKVQSEQIISSDVNKFLKYITEHIIPGKLLQIPCSYNRDRHIGSTISFTWTNPDTGTEHNIETESSSEKLEILENFYWPLKKAIEELPGVSFCDFSVYDDATSKTGKSAMFVCGIVICPSDREPCHEYKQLQRLLWEKSMRILPYNLGLPGGIRMEFNTILEESLLDQLIMFRPDVCQAILNYIDGLDMGYFTISQKYNMLYIEYSKKTVPYTIELNLEDY